MAHDGDRNRAKERMERARQRDAAEANKRKNEETRRKAIDELERKIESLETRAATRRRVGTEKSLDAARGYEAEIAKLRSQVEFVRTAKAPTDRKWSTSELRKPPGPTEAPKGTTVDHDGDSPSPERTTSGSGSWWDTMQDRLGVQESQAPTAPVRTGNIRADELAARISGLGTLPSDPLDALLGLDPNAQVYEGVRFEARRGPNRERRGGSGLLGNVLSSIGVHESTSVGSLLQDFFSFDGKELRDLQYDLFAGGFYGDTAPEDIAWGVAGDNTTYSAWTAAVTRASRFYAAGKKLTVDDVIKMAAKDAGNDDRAKNGRGGGGGATTIELSDPKELAETVNAAAKKILGRGATPEEKRLFIAAIHSRQRQRDMARGSGDAASRDPLADARILASGGQLADDLENPTVDVMNVSTEAQALDFARRADPVRADSRKVIEKFQMIAEMLGGGGL